MRKILRSIFAFLALFHSHLLHASAISHFSLFGEIAAFEERIRNNYNAEVTAYPSYTARPSEYLERLRQEAQEEAALKRVNPRFGEGGGFQQNCDFAVNIYEHYLRFGNFGAYTSAPKFQAENKIFYIIANMRLLFTVAPNTSRHTADSIQEIEDVLRVRGNGARAIVKGYRPFSPGQHTFHSWSAFLIDGQVYHKCPQSGRTLPFPFQEFSSFAYYITE